MMTLQHIINLSKIFLSAPECLICRCQTSGDRICRDCYQALPWNISACQQCAIPLPRAGLYCANCLQRPPQFRYSRIAFRYQTPIQQLLKRLKFQQQLHYVPLLAELFVAYLERHPLQRPNLVIPVPLHRKRQQQRGFNQANEIAKLVCSKLRLRLNAAIAIRVLNTQPQSLLPVQARRRNTAAAFRYSQSLQGQRVAIFDDIFTSGETVNELSRCLLRAGATSVDIWCCARSEPK